MELRGKIPPPDFTCRAPPINFLFHNHPLTFSFADSKQAFMPVGARFV